MDNTDYRLFDEKHNSSNEIQPNEKEDSFRQNASFAEKNLLNESMFFPNPDDHDIRKIDRTRVEHMMLHAVNLSQNETAPELVRLGSQGINHWIWEHLVHNKITPLLFRTFLSKRLKNNAKGFYSHYKQVYDLTQRVSEFHQIHLSQLQDTDFLNEEFIKHFEMSSSTNFKDHNFYKQMIRHAQKYYPELDSPVPIIFNTTRKKVLHPFVVDYRKHLIKYGIAEVTQLNKLNYLSMLISWLCKQLIDFSKFESHTIPLLQVREWHLYEFRSYLLKQLKADRYSMITGSECIYAIKDFFRFLKRKYPWFSDPSIRLESIKAPRYSYRQIPNDSQIQHFFNIVYIYSDRPLIEIVAFNLLVYLGLRSDEVAHVAWKDINLSNRTITIHSKGGKEHLLPLVGKLLENLHKLKNTQCTDGFLLGPNIEANKYNLLTNYHLYALIAGWEFPGGLHLFRHIFVTRLAGTNPLPQLLKDLTRVVRTDTVSLYLHIVQKRDQLTQEINRLDYGK